MMGAVVLRESPADPADAAARGLPGANELDARAQSTRNVASAPAHLDTALRLTAIALLLRPMGPWFVRPAILAAAVTILIFPRALRNSLVWGAIALLTAVRIVSDWPLADNHIYLLCYWLLAVALSLRALDPAAGLAFTGRWLIGLAFAFAVLWKVVLSPDFIDGRFFRVTLLTDPRFDAATQIVGGLSAEQLEANRKAVTLLPQGAELLNPPAVVEPFRLRAFATLSTWGILCLEGAIALLMLVPATRVPGGLRHAALLLFCGVTYAFAPVAGFGWLLLVIGLAQVAPAQKWLGRAYVATFLCVLFYDELPWAEMTLELLR
jgi:hypothetical protein